MDRELVVKLAQEAGAHEKHEVYYLLPEELERFAALVAAHERERICKQIAMLHDSLSLTGTANWGRT